MENDKNTNKIETPAADVLLKKIRELEEGHAHLQEEISELIISGEYKSSDRQRSNSASPGSLGTVCGVFEAETFTVDSTSYRQILPLRRRSNYKMFRKGGGTVVDGGGALKLTENQYLNILQSMGQALHVFDLSAHIIYWNQMAQDLYGYTVGEALGKTAPEIIIAPKYKELANIIIYRGIKGESWSGEFPVRNKRWEKFTVVTTVSPFFDENGTIRGALCISTDARPFRKTRPQASVSGPWKMPSSRFGLDLQQPIQTAIVSKISNLASKVKSKMKTRANNIDDDDIDDVGVIGFEDYSDITLCDHGHTESPYGVFSNKPGIHEILSSKAEAWMGKNGLSWPWKGNGSEGGDSSIRFVNWPWIHSDQDKESGHETSSTASLKVGSQMYESVTNTTEAPGSWSSTCEASSSESTNSNVITKLDIDIDNLDVEISWDDLVINEQIGQGIVKFVWDCISCTVDVALKVFNKQEYPDDVILSFRKEVSLMKRLRHPNILLFMGAVTSPQHLCIVTEFLPRGSLFRLLQRNTIKLDWRRRIHMAMDIARGMNYLHHCNPPIIHCDLKSSNLLVDKNWNVKVGDFGLSRIKRETYLSTNTGKGTPQWMAPDVLRNEQADEKSDVYSYGVVLWELTTEKIPWDNLNSMQVIGAVGFMNQRLEIPNDVDPQWASLIESCWSRSHVELTAAKTDHKICLMGRY
ncbi:hypothetical protein L1887_19695 [Cichorium endivia]|nr:hypothetical protein L1887_19695 [Cichorium endivia]